MELILFITGIYFTFSLGFFQFTHIKDIIKAIFSKSDKKGESTSPFESLMTALAGSVGTGNIAGVASAISLGGSGAIFWMWVSGFFAMMTKYAEVLLAVKFRQKNRKGEYIGGCMYIIKNGLKSKAFFKLLSVIFALFGISASLFSGNMVQSNTISTAFCSYIGTSDTKTKLIVGIILSFIVSIVILKGAKSVNKANKFIMPIMGSMYIIFSVSVIIKNSDMILPAFSSLFNDVFDAQKVVGGIGGFFVTKAFKVGISKGTFSNEAGMGSSPIAHAQSQVISPVHQAVFGIAEVFFDTHIICTLTALAVLTSGVDLSSNGMVIVISAFSSIFSMKTSAFFLTMFIFFFSISSVLSWSLYGTRCFEFLTGGKYLKLYLVIFIISTALGTLTDTNFVWSVGEKINILMAMPNILSIILLSGTVVVETREFIYYNRVNKNIDRKSLCKIK